MNSEHQNLRQLLFALLAMAIGMLLAWSQLALREPNDLPQGMVAKVGDAMISEADFNRAIAATESARRTALSPPQRAAVLNKLIDEQLLLQYGENLGLVYSDPLVRKPLVQSVLGLVRANVSRPGVEDARQWYRENSALFEPPALYQVRVYLIADEVLANAAVTQLRKPRELSALLQKSQLDYIPRELLPEAKLLDYIGRDGVAELKELKAPVIVGPLPLMGQHAVIDLVARRQPLAPPYADVEEQVINAVIRERGEQALAKLAKQLRAESNVRIRRSSLDG